MLRKTITIAAVTPSFVALIFFVAGRPFGELAGYMRATADQTVDGLAEQLPEEIHDRKINHDLTTARQELVDQQIKLNLSCDAIDKLRASIERLKASITRRKRLLAEAYPALKLATEQEKTYVRFANSDFSLSDFRKEIDDMMTLQTHEEERLRIKQEGIDHLEQRVRDWERTLAERHQGLEATEQKVAVLQSRREQAHLVSKMLDWISPVTFEEQPFQESLGRLETKVNELEAINRARHDLAPVESEQDNQISRAWRRLEELKAYHHEFIASRPHASEEPAASSAVNTRAAEVVGENPEASDDE